MRFSDFHYKFFKVYLVQYGGDHYAIKVLRKNTVLEGQDLAYVMLERQIMAESHSNPFIIQLIYAFQNVERLFFFMEVARAGNFYRILLKQTPRPFPYERIIFHSAEIACALSFLHSKSIVCTPFLSCCYFFIKTYFIFIFLIGIGLSWFKTRKCSCFWRWSSQIRWLWFV